MTSVLAARREEQSRKRPLGCDGQRFTQMTLIGQGSYGRVYRAWDSENGVRVAVKQFKDDGREGIAATTLREIAVLKMLKHDNIVKCAFSTAVSVPPSDIGLDDLGDLGSRCRLLDVVELPELALVFEYIERDLADYINGHSDAHISSPSTVKVRLLFRYSFVAAHAFSRACFRRVPPSCRASFTS